MSVTKIANGGTVIVRTGVLQGVGPIGPQGPRGFEGPAGGPGPAGPTGSQGAVVENYSMGTLAAPVSLASGASANLGFNAVIDENDVFQSLTNLTPGTDGTYYVSLYAVFTAPANEGDGSRTLTFYQLLGGAETRIGFAKVAAAPDGTTVLSLSGVFRRADGATYHVRAGSTDDVAVSVSEARITYNRIGAGARGAVGPAGVQGPLGPQGPAGPTGPPGSATDGFDTFEDLRGD